MCCLNTAITHLRWLWQMSTEQWRNNKYPRLLCKSQEILKYTLIGNMQRLLILRPAMYEGKSMSELQMDIELKQTRVLIWKILLFLNVISLYTEALVPLFHEPLKISTIKFFGLLSEPGGDFPSLPRWRLARIVTGDEFWVHCYRPKTKRASPAKRKKLK
jgi:hypothetical protein